MYTVWAVKRLIILIAILLLVTITVAFFQRVDAVVTTPGNPDTAYVVTVYVGPKAEYKANTVVYQGDRLVLTDYYERQGNAWRRGADALVISGSYVVRQRRMNAQ